ncbi:MAG: TonB-dependent receptor [Desulfarculaceae bacterium]|jgi:vitamin B12 transporter
MMQKTQIKRYLSLAAILALLSAPAAQPATAAEALKQPEMVVTATKTEEKLDQLHSTVYLITDQDMDEKGILNLPDAIREVPGLYVRGNSLFGGPTSVTIRGAEAGQVRLMLDGVRLADPIAPSGEFNLSLLNVDAVDQIEVVQGPQSTLYGSDAMGGVINIISKRGQGKPTAWALGEGGSFNTWRGQVGSQGQVDKFNFFVNGSGLTSEGFSNAKDQPEKDYYSNLQLNTRIGYEFSPSTEIYAIGYFHRAHVDYDSFYGEPADSDDAVKKTAWTGILGFRQGVFDWWDHKLTLSTGESKRDYSDGSEFNSQLHTVEWQHNLHYQDISTLTVGVDWEEEKGDFNSPLYDDRLDSRSAAVLGLYLQEQLKLWKSLFLTGGIRSDNHQEFGQETTWKVGAAYRFAKTDTKLRANYGTGFKAPTIYQLYSQYGDINLDPEKSKGWDVGVDQGFWGGRLKLGLTYFQLETDELIVWDSDTWKYKNIDEAESSGVEFMLQAKLTDWLSLDGSFTHTDSEDKTTGKEIKYIPREKVTLGLRFKPLEGLVARIYGIYIGKRYADDDNTEQMDGYTVVNLAASYEVNKHLKVFARVLNLFDEDYEEIKDYQTMGLSAFGGIRVSF